jgi:hypothetical protein
MLGRRLDTVDRGGRSKPAGLSAGNREEQNELMVDAAVPEGLAEGERLLASTEWAAAAVAFESVLAVLDNPAAPYGL